METVVWWNAGGGSLNKEVEWRQWFSGTQEGESLYKEVEWRQWFSGMQGGSLNKEVEL